MIWIKLSRNGSWYINRCGHFKCISYLFLHLSCKLVHFLPFQMTENHAYQCAWSWWILATFLLLMNLAVKVCSLFFSPAFCNFVQGSLFLSSYYIVIRLPTLSLSCIPESEFSKATLPQCYKHMNILYIWRILLFLDEWVCSQLVGLSSISYLVLYILLSKLEVERCIVEVFYVK